VLTGVDVTGDQVAAMTKDVANSLAGIDIGHAPATPSMERCSI
jgi:hypothetical protein